MKLSKAMKKSGLPPLSLAVVALLFLAVSCSRSASPGEAGRPESPPTPRDDVAANTTAKRRDEPEKNVEPQSQPVAASAVATWTRYSAAPGKGSKVTVEGTSTLHDWTVEGLIVGGTLEAGPNFAAMGTKAKPGKVDVRVDVYIPVRSLKSMKEGKPYSTMMDDIMYRKLLETVHKRILYHLTELTLKEVAQAADAPFGFEARGELVVAGVTNSITMPVQMTFPGTNQLRFSGSAGAKMTDFKIEPPSPEIPGVGKLIKTGDDVKLKFDWVIQKR